MHYESFPTQYTHPVTGDLFQIQADAASTGQTRTFRNIENTFGDGYVQIVAQGIQTHEDEWSVKFTSHKDAIQYMWDFLSDRNGEQPFYWSPNNYPQGVSEIRITSGGSGYTAAPTVSLTGGGGTGATAQAVVSGGVVTSVFVLTAGSGYTSNPTVAFSGGGGSGAAATAIASLLWRSDSELKRSDLRGDSASLSCKFIRWYGAVS